MKAMPELRDAVLIGFARREQGVIVPRGNPLRIKGIHDVATGPRVAVRPAGAGAQLLLESLLGREGLDISQLRSILPPCPTGLDIAQAILAGRADCGIATRSVANTAGLDFVTLKWEQFDLVVRHREYFRPPLQTFFSFLGSEIIHRRATQASGYDISAAGHVRHAP